MELEFAKENILSLGDRSGVYFLFHGEELVYVGKTTKGIKRIFQHDNKIFDGYYFQDVDLGILSLTEKELITKYKPKYNLAIPGQKPRKREQKEKELYEKIHLKPHKLRERENIDYSTYMKMDLVKNSKDLKQFIVLQWLEYNSLLKDKGLLYNGEIYFYLDYELMAEELPYIYSSWDGRFRKLIKNLKEGNFIKTISSNNNIYYSIPNVYRVLNKKIIEDK